MMGELTPWNGRPFVVHTPPQIGRFQIPRHPWMCTRTILMQNDFFFFTFGSLYDYFICTLIVYILLHPIPSTIAQYNGLYTSN